jgi:acetyl-CoA carboxylase carboxyl transferase subunit alpha
LKEYGVVDDVIPEPLGGAHRNPKEMSATLRAYLSRSLRELADLPIPQLLDARYAKFRTLGQYAV